MVMGILWSPASGNLSRMAFSNPDHVELPMDDVSDQFILLVTDLS
jgi:hypothetical protein